MKQNIENWFRRHRTSLLGVLVVCLLPCGGLDVGAQPTGKALRISDFQLRTPTVAIPYYHFTVRLNLPAAGSVYIRELRVNSNPVRNYFLLGKDESLDPNQPKNRRRMVIAEGKKDTTIYKHPTLIGRLDWHNGRSYKLDIALSMEDKSNEIFRANTQGNAPAKGGYWNKDWKYYQSVVVTETAGLNRTAEPVEATLLFYRDAILDATREIRVIRYDYHRKVHHEVSSQVLDFVAVDTFTLPPMYGENGKRKPPTFVPTSSATIVFQANVSAYESSVYLVFYGNLQARTPNYTSDLKITGTAPGVTIENNAYHLKLHDASGMLDEVTLKSKPQYKFVHKKETNGAIQWNPGCYAPPRPWAHLSDWEPEKHDYEYEELRGPVVFITRRWGQMPMIPELACSMEYRFYAGLPYFVMSSSVHVRHDIAVQALRNAEVVFEREAFSEAAWCDPIRQRVETHRIISAPDLTEWIMPDCTPWIAFFDRSKGCGYAGIQIQYANAGLERRPRTLNPYMYITVGPWIYWTRALAYPYGSRNPQQLTKLAAGSVFLEQWAYLPFELPDEESQFFRQVQQRQEVLTHPLHVHIDEPIDIRMEIPDEIYIEPEKTGWEEKKKDQR